MTVSTVLNSKEKCEKCRTDKKKVIVFRLCQSLYRTNAPQCVLHTDPNESRCVRCVEKGCRTCNRAYIQKDDSAPGHGPSFYRAVQGSDYSTTALQPMSTNASSAFAQINNTLNQYSQPTRTSMAYPFSSSRSSSRLAQGPFCNIDTVSYSPQESTRAFQDYSQVIDPVLLSPRDLLNKTVIQSQKKPQSSASKKLRA